MAKTEDCGPRSRAPNPGDFCPFASPLGTAVGHALHSAKFALNAIHCVCVTKLVPRNGASLPALRLREIGPIAHEEERLEWKLLTTIDARETLDIQRVIEAYTYRWRIEEFHKTWKSGACNGEDSQLRSYEAIVKWATVLGAVATRVERRETPFSHDTRHQRLVGAKSR